MELEDYEQSKEGGIRFVEVYFGIWVAKYFLRGVQDT